MEDLITIVVVGVFALLLYELLFREDDDDRDT